MEQDTPTPETQSAGSTPLQKGDIVKGKITKIVGAIAFVDLDQHQARIPITELQKEDDTSFEIGDEIEAQVVNTQRGVELSRKYIANENLLDELEFAFKENLPVEATVHGVNKGGFELRVNDLRAFCRFREFSPRQERHPQRYIGKTFSFKIIELSREGKTNIVVSRLTILEEEAQEKSQKLSTHFNVGDVIHSKVAQLTKFGAFMKVGHEIEGLIPMSELTHSRINQASDVLKVGERLEVKVIGIDPERGRLTLSRRQMIPDPWETFVSAQELGSTHKGQVTRLTDYGAFVKLAPHVEGLLHVGSISSTERIGHPSDRFSVKDEIEVVIEEVVRGERRRLRLMTPEVAESRRPIDINLKVGEVITAPVAEVKEQGISLQIASNLQGFVPASATGTERGTNLTERFPIGTEIRAKITTVDLKRGRVRLSIQAMERHEEEMAFKQYKNEEPSPQMGTSFGDLLKDFLKP